MIPPGPARRLGSRYWTMVGSLCLAAAFAVTLIHASPATPVLFGRILLRSLVHSVTMGALAGLIVPWVARCVAPRRSAGRWALMIAAMLALAVAGTFVANAVIELLALAPHESFWTRFRGDLRVVALVTVAISIGVTLFEALRSQLESTTAALHARELEQERARKLAVEARLQSLEARLHPHFLFNALNAISALIAEDPVRAERMVERLAALLRFALDAGRRGMVPLAEEMKLVGDYLEIEKARLGDRLSYAVEVDAEVAACAVPPLSVQTLVENSVKHVIAPRPQGGRLRVGAIGAGGSVIVRVWDDGAGFALDGGGPGHGLDNLQSRLADRFGEKAALIVAREDGGTLVTMTLPRSPAELAAPA